MIAGQHDGVGGLAAGNVASDSMISALRAAKFAKLAIATITAVLLVGLYIGTKQVLSVENFDTGQSRTFHIDISEACIHGSETPPLFEAREGDRVVLAVTSLFPGELFLHGLETEVNIVPGAENTITFTAEHAGRFYLHLHGTGNDHTHVELAVLEVAPR